MFASFADSVNACANVNIVSKLPAGKIALVVQLTRVRDPLVDQNQAWTVLDEQLAQHVARARRLLIIFRDAVERLLAAKLPGQFAPQRMDHRAIRFRCRISWGDLVADEDHALHFRQALRTGFAHHRIDTGQVS